MILLIRQIFGVAMYAHHQQQEIPKNKQPKQSFEIFYLRNKNDMKGERQDKIQINIGSKLTGTGIITFPSVSVAIKSGFCGPSKSKPRS